MMPPLFNLIIDLSPLTDGPCPGVNRRPAGPICSLGRVRVCRLAFPARTKHCCYIMSRCSLALNESAVFARDKRCQWRRDGERCGCSQMLTRRSWQPILLISTAGRQLCFCPQRHLPGNPLDIYSACELRRASYCIFLPFIATFARANIKLLR